MALKGKQLSLISKLLALLFVFVCFGLKVFAKIEIPINDTIKVALFAALIFAPVDISLWMETFFTAFTGLRSASINNPPELLKTNQKDNGWMSLAQNKDTYVSAIKAYRDLYKSSLKEAKEAIDGYVANQQSNRGYE